MDGEDDYSLSNSCKPLVYTLKEEGRASLNRTWLLQNLLYCFERAKSFYVHPTMLLQLTDSHNIHIFVLQFFFLIHSLDVVVHTGAKLIQLQDDLLWQSFCLL
jgi:hypothetical protein